MAQNFQYVTPHNVGMPGSVNYNGGSMALLWRTPLDATLAQQGARVPGAMYPDGYLGEVRSRRAGRMLDQLGSQLNQKSYQRGVHKGERIDPADYFWPPELQPTAGLRRQATTGQRAAPLGTLLEQLQANGGTDFPVGPRGKMQPIVPEYAPDPIRQQVLRSLLPDWRTA